jgi:hypothetical protein
MLGSSSVLTFTKAASGSLADIPQMEGAKALPAGS